MIPSRLYEALPALYVVAGVVAMIAATDWLGRGSGALLVSAGVAIFRLRWAYRSANGLHNLTTRR